MMTWVDIMLLSVALAMDCFTVSIVSGVIMGRRWWRIIIRLSVLFGLFQALMPLLGWLSTSYLAQYIQDYDHWVAFGMLAFLGGRMIRDSFRPEEDHHFSPADWKTGVTMAVATSIDALAVGISLAMADYERIGQLVLPLVVIGLGSFLFSIIGHLLGIRFGGSIRSRLRPELLGGIILIGIGVKILMTHLC